MPAKPKIVPAMEGRNARLIIRQDRVRQSFAFKTWNLKPNVTKHNDGVNGEDRDRLSVTLNFYEISGEMYEADLAALDAFLAAQAARDAKDAPLDADGAVRFQPNNGTNKSYVLVELVHDDFDLKQGGRSDKIMTTVNFRCADMQEARTL